MKDRDERKEDKLEEAICGLGGMIGQLVRELSQINNNQAILCRLAEMEQRILMTSAQLETALNNNTTQIGKIALEQSTRFDVLTETIRLLNEQIGQGGAVTPGVETAQANVQTALDSLDAAIPDAPVVIPPTSPA